MRSVEWCSARMEEAIVTTRKGLAEVRFVPGSTYYETRPHRVFKATGRYVGFRLSWWLNRRRKADQDMRDRQLEWVRLPKAKVVSK